MKKVRKSLLIGLTSVMLLLSGCGKEEEQYEEVQQYHEEEVSSMVDMTKKLSNIQLSNISIKDYTKGIKKYEGNIEDEVYNSSFNANTVEVDRKLRYMDFGVGLYSKHVSYLGGVVGITSELNEYVIEHRYVVQVVADEENRGTASMDKMDDYITMIYRVKGQKIIGYTRYDKSSGVEGARE